MQEGWSPGLRIREKIPLREWVCNAVFRGGSEAGTMINRFRAMWRIRERFIILAHTLAEDEEFRYLRKLMS